MGREKLAGRYAVRSSVPRVGAVSVPPQVGDAWRFFDGGWGIVREVIAADDPAAPYDSDGGRIAFFVFVSDLDRPRGRGIWWPHLSMYDAERVPVEDYIAERGY